MAEIINLRMARKARKRADAAREADASRARHGETAGERRKREQAAARLARDVDGARRETD